MTQAWRLKTSTLDPMPFYLPYQPFKACRFPPFTFTTCSSPIRWKPYNSETNSALPFLPMASNLMALCPVPMALFKACLLPPCKCTSWSVPTQLPFPVRLVHLVSQVCCSKHNANTANIVTVRVHSVATLLPCTFTGLRVIYQNIQCT